MTLVDQPPLHALGPQDRLRALSLVKEGRVFDLDCGRWPGMPLWRGHPPFQVVAYRTPHGMNVEGDQSWRGPNGVGFAWHSELMMGTMHTGTHIDALSHWTCGSDNHWFGGVSANERTGDFGPLQDDATEIPSIIARGVLLDVAGANGVSVLPGGYAIGRADLEATLKSQGTELHPGDVVIIRTGYLSVWPDPTRIDTYRDSGINLEATEFLLEHGMVAVGGDTESVEVQPSGDPNDPQPLHRRALNESGVYIIEMLNTEELAAAHAYEFCFVCLPLKVKYATGSMVHPVALT